MRTMKTQIDIIKKFNEIYIVFNTLDKHDGGGVGFTWFKTSEDATTWAIKRNNMGLQFISSAAILVTKTKIDELCRKWWICFDMCEKLVNDGWIPGLGKRTVTLVKCGNCGKKTDKANYIKWHGDKCKLASNNFFKPILTSFPFQ